MANEIYSVAGDTANGKADVGLLHSEIDADVTITTALNWCQEDGDTLTIAFAGSISAGEKTALDAVVAAHTGERDSTVTGDITITTQRYIKVQNESGIANIDLPPLADVPEYHRIAIEKDSTNGQSRAVNIRDSNGTVLETILLKGTVEEVMKANGQWRFV